MNTFSKENTSNEERWWDSVDAPLNLASFKYIPGTLLFAQHKKTNGKRALFINLISVSSAFFPVIRIDNMFRTKIVSLFSIRGSENDLRVKKRIQARCLKGNVAFSPFSQPLGVPTVARRSK